MRGLTVFQTVLVGMLFRFRLFSALYLELMLLFKGVTLPSRGAAEKNS